MRQTKHLTAMFNMAAAATCACAVAAVAAAEPSAVDLEFYEKQIRPLLTEHCLKCHGPDDTKGNLRLDSHAEWLAGGDTGPAIVAGKPEESLLIAAVRYEDEYLEMPPKERLPAAKIKLLEEWVRRGAPGPASSDSPVAAKPAIDIEAGRKFWAYQPIARPETTGSIDSFIIRKLDAAGLAPNPPANPEVLVRRVYFDLHGLPPTIEQIDAFLGDTRADAYKRLVDELLASPHFGERWGRHWLDIARFGESLTLRGFVLPEAWRFRDYVIDVFNEDRPFDQFLREQIAGDLLPADSLEQRQRQLIATTFLTLGNTNLEEQDKKQLDMDVVDEQLDTIGKAILAQTIGCARCHDHKFDPIPTKDYYAMAGILRSTQALDHANVSKWKQVPLPLTPPEEQRLLEQKGKLADLDTELEQVRQQIAAIDRRAGPDDFRRPRVLPVEDLPGIVIDDTQATKVGIWQDSQYSKRYVGKGYTHDQNQQKGEKSLTFSPTLPHDGRYEVRLAYTAGDNRARNVPVTIFSAEGEKAIVVDQQQPPALDGFFVSLGEYRFEKAGQSFVLIATEHTDGHVIADAVQFLPVEEAKPAERPDVDPKLISELADLRSQQRQIEANVADLRKGLEKRPQVMTIVERKECDDCPIHVRGSVHSLGEVAPRGFLQVVSPQLTEPLPTNESGRRELAAWLASDENPLTPRVYANRTWHWLFGQGLVRTTDNFGATGEVPSHPELLDALARQFVERGWSVKKLVRTIVLSEAYRRSSSESAEGLAQDPENHLLWRMNRKRIEAECLRDAMLLASGELDLACGGSTIPAGLSSDFGQKDASFRRSVYLPVYRNALPELFAVFDFADPSIVVGNRNVSTVAPQALYLMNHPFVIERSANAAKRLLADAATDDRTCMALAFRGILAREPSDAERAHLEKFLTEATETGNRQKAWAQVVQTLFGSLDFRYRD